MKVTLAGLTGRLAPFAGLVFTAVRSELLPAGIVRTVTSCGNDAPLAFEQVTPNTVLFPTVGSVMRVSVPPARPAIENPDAAPFDTLQDVGPPDTDHVICTCDPSTIVFVFPALTQPPPP